MKNILKTGMAVLVAAAALSSCSDWTEPEAVGIKYETAGEAEPETYAKYLENLRAYRSNGHKKAYAFLSNTESFASQATHVSSVPDSIDVLVLERPHLVNDAILNEMVEKRTQTGMEMAYSIDYAAIKASWTSKKELETAEKPAPEWNAFLTDSVKTALSYGPMYSFNRVVACYDGLSTGMMNATELASYTTEQTLFLGAIKDYCKANNLGFDLVGVPVNVVDNSVLEAAGVLFLSETLSASNFNELQYLVNRNSGNGVPASKFGILANLPVLDVTKPEIGHWGDGFAAIQSAYWARQNEATKAVGMLNLVDDYYNPTFVYPVCRQAIQTLNPAAK